MSSINCSRIISKMRIYTLLHLQLDGLWWGIFEELDKFEDMTNWAWDV